MGYNCVVLIKQVPDTKKITGDVMNDDGTVKRSALPAIFNPEDLNALELALQIKDRLGGHITVITMGLPAASAILRDSLFRGADDAILITDTRCAASDTLATSYILSCAVKKNDYDIVLCGRQAIDGDTAQVGPQVAEYLDIPQITYVRNIHVNGKKLLAERVIDDGYEKIECSMPVLITVIKEINKPRYPTIDKIMYACSEYADIKIWNAGDIGAMADKTGLTGSPTNVKHVFTPDHKRKGEILSGTPDSIAKELLDRLKGKNII